MATDDSFPALPLAQDGATANTVRLHLSDVHDDHGYSQGYAWILAPLVAHYYSAAIDANDFPTPELRAVRVCRAGMRRDGAET